MQDSARIQELKSKLEKENDELESKQKEIINKARVEARNLLLDAKEEADAIIKDIQNSVSSKELHSKRNKLNDNIKNMQNSIGVTHSNDKDMPIDAKDIAVGMTVFVSSLNSNGIVLSLPNKSNKVLVQCGSISSSVDIGKLFSAKNTVGAHNCAQGIHNISPKKSQTISNEINVIGYNTEEAIFAVDKYIDNAYLARLPSVRIVHGKGTGTLRKNIQQFLKEHSLVKSFRVGTFGEGEMGVTVVELK